MKHTILSLTLFLFSNLLMAEDTGIKHIVLCWLNAPDSASDLTAVMETSRELKDLPMVAEIIVGQAVASDRDIVDDSFDVGLVMDFKNREVLEEYLVHEEHIRRVKEVLAPKCKRIQVYDIGY